MGFTRCIKRASAMAGFAMALLVLLSASLSAQMVNPSMDAGSGPFSYYSHPTDEIGVMDAPSATLVSPEGFFYTGYGELMFFTGNPEVPIAQRVKTLLDGYLPVIQYGFTRDGIAYRFTAFAATLDGTPSGTLVDFIRVDVGNETSGPRVAWLSSGMRYEGTVNQPNGLPDNRYRRPATGSKPGDYTQPGAVFHADWSYSSGNDSIQRDGQILYEFPEVSAHTVRYTLHSGASASGLLAPQVLKVLPTTPVGIVQYKIALQPGQHAVFDWKLPVIPVAADSEQEKDMAAAAFDTYLPRTVAFWNNILQQGLSITVPEEKVNDAFKASLVYDLIARNKVGDDYVQTVNDLHYHAFWLRDSSFIARMYDVTGYPRIARQVIDFFAQWQQPDGNFVSQGGQYDGIGQTLWAYGQHYALTHDRDFADQVFPSVVRAVRWIEQARQADPLHLMPATTPGDNEDITGHVTGHDFWALDGLRGAILLAHATGHAQEEQEFQKEYDDFRSTLLAVLARVTQSTGGTIPPGLDGQHGQDWGNMLALYPGLVLPEQSPMVTATLNATRAKYQEGIMTYADGRMLHDYLAFSNTETELILGRQQWAVEDLYNELLHTSSTHAGFETDITPWGDRDFGGNLSPHGWFAARLRIALRDMLVREQGSELHLLSAVSPDWIRSGASIGVERAVTNFGTVSFSLRNVSATRAELTLHSSFVDPPARIILHLPWFMQTSSVMADGDALAIHDDSVTLPAHAQRIEIQWTRLDAGNDLSYDATVARYKQEYARRYREFETSGKQSPGN